MLTNVSIRIFCDFFQNELMLTYVSIRAHFSHSWADLYSAAAAYPDLSECIRNQTGLPTNAGPDMGANYGVHHAFHS